MYAKLEVIYTVSIEGDAILSVQREEHRETELRWDGATELIRVEGPDRATRNENN